jgi:hypothetical protein
MQKFNYIRKMYKKIWPLLMLWLLTSQISMYAQNWDQVLKSTSNPRNNTDYYGYKVSIDGDYAVVGSPYHDYDQFGINFLYNSGAVFVLKKDESGNWVQHQKLVAPDRVQWDLFGWEVNIQDDAIIIGAIGNDRDVNNNFLSWSCGAVYIFRKLADGNFYNEQKLVPPDAAGSYSFGVSADIDGKYAIVGKTWESYDYQNQNYMNSAGAAYIYEKTTQGKWILHKKITPSDRDSFDYFGRSVSISGNHAVIGSYRNKYPISKTNNISFAGAAYIYTNFNGIWGQNQKLTAPNRRYFDYFGFSVSMDDSLLLIGAHGNDLDAYGNNWVNGSGAAYLFKREGFVWKHAQKIVPIDRTAGSLFGQNVNVKDSTLIVGAYLHRNDYNYQNPLLGAGAAYVFEKAITQSYHQTTKLLANSRDTQDQFGGNVAYSDGFAIVGAHLEDDNRINLNKKVNSGSAYIFKTCNSKSEIIVNACKTYTSPSGNNTWTQSGDYKDVIKNFKGCDSVISIKLNISQPDTQYLSETACGSFTSPSGNYVWTQSGQYTDYIQNTGTCDSVRIIDLVVNKHSSKSFSISNCGPYTSPSGNNVWNKDGVYQDVIPNYLGCDSLLSISLKIVEPTYATHHVSACQSFGKFSRNGAWNRSGIYYDTISNWVGCDSILTIILSINNPDTGVVNFGNQLIATANDGLYQWLDCNKNYERIMGADGQSFYAKDNGSYALDVADNGCRDTTSCHVLYRVDVDEVKQPELSIYPNPSDGKFQVENPNRFVVNGALFNTLGIKIKDLSFSESNATPIDLSSQPDGVYVLLLVDEKGNRFQFNLIKI